MAYHLIGHPLGHSCSPELHRLLGNPDYGLLDLPEDEVEALILGKAYDGLNVTIPYKRKAAALMDVLTDRARETGAVNTVVKTPDGKLLGDNTDIDGLTQLAAKAGIALKGRRVLILGTGGTAQTADYVARKNGAASVRQVSRSGALNYQNVYEQASDSEVIINATPVGMSPDLDGQPVDLSCFPALRGVLDVVYNPLRTALTEQARALGIPCANGLRMLAEQARTAEALFMGKAVSDETANRAYKELLRNHTSIVLIGMPGCGKSSVGKAVAAAMHRAFLDTDQMVVQASGMEIPAVFAKYGEARFRELEAEAVREASARQGAVIAVGGGAPLRPENRVHLRRNGWICLVRRPLDRLDRAGRPLSASDEALARMAELREPYYTSLAEAWVTNESSVDDCAKRIMEAFESHADSGD